MYSTPEEVEIPGPECRVEVPVDFLRGDCDGDGEVEALGDAIYLLTYGFADGSAPPCRKAADGNGNGELTPVPDALFLLRFGFLDGAPPPAPGPDVCGEEPEPSDLSCEVPPVCD